MQNRADGIYGVMAEFETPDELIAAAHAARHAGYTRMDAFSPFPIEEVIEEVAPGDTGVPRLVLIAGLTGAATGFILQYIGNVIDYPLNIGGRPLDITNWPAMIPITFEMGILMAAFTAAISMVILNGLPSPYHPVFNVPRFERASQDAFFLCIEATDPLFDRAQTSSFLRSLGPMQVTEVAE
ncbi:DUF3341 domain-containing protein [Candidatus Viridilinea mediisalina]|uniref:DUF3341 domain-containing protein n=1 Tax=Candidatus Viridilinea mediisalina TaxID=2024553 RepID=A0A2A6RM88_9CHLR|nr:DUF3341 domain-containing protein [Candidatus Viridilinea mediisalina]PDW03998.1 hypothetical protein CJ255_05920 [Candidatus Viridilinea mediisalina]